MAKPAVTHSASHLCEHICQKNNKHAESNRMLLRGALKLAARADVVAGRE